MSSDVVLSAALRSNLLSLQQTQRGIDSSQFKLSTGKKVNSALDNPQSFFASQALTNRAEDLTKLLDGIGQSIQVIKAADNGVTALTSLVNSAQAIATSAQDALATASGAKVVSTQLGTATIATGAGGFVTTGDTFDITAIDANGLKNKQTITFNTGDTGAVMAAKITAAFSASGSVTGSVDSNGAMNISGASGYSFRIDNFRTVGGVAYSLAQGQAAISATGLGLVNFFRTAGEENSGGATQGIGATVNATSVITSGALTSGGSTATLGTKISNLQGFAGITAATSLLSVQVDSAAATNIDLFTGNVTVQGLIDKLNVAGAGNFTAAFDTSSGKISLTVTNAAVKTISLGNASTAATTLNFGFGSGRTDNVSVTDNITETFAIPSTAGVTSTLSTLQNQYNAVRAQIDALVTNGDTAYRGTNLLNGNNLVTNFNELRTSKLTTAGVTFNSAGLGLSAATFSTAATITANLTQITSALTSLRNFGSSLAGDLSTIQTRQEFTSSTINTLTTGSDLLVNADQNEEGAKLLALQTRQSLGVTALSLASQSQQSILRLFG